MYFSDRNSLCCYKYAIAVLFAKINLKDILFSGKPFKVKRRYHLFSSFIFLIITLFVLKTYPYICAFFSSNKSLELPFIDHRHLVAHLRKLPSQLNIGEVLHSTSYLLLLALLMCSRWPIFCHSEMHIVSYIN